MVLVVVVVVVVGGSEEEKEEVESTPKTVVLVIFFINFLVKSYFRKDWGGILITILGFEPGFRCLRA